MALAGRQRLFGPHALKVLDGGTLWTEEVARADSFGFAWLAAEPGPGVAVGDALPADVKVVFLDNFNAVMLRSGSWVRCELVSKSTASSWTAQRVDYLRAAAGSSTSARPASTSRRWRRNLEASASGSSDDDKKVRVEGRASSEVLAKPEGLEDQVEGTEAHRIAQEDRVLQPDAAPECN